MNTLITGGTGSFGQALTARLLKTNTYSRICIYSRDEHKQDIMSKKFNDARLRFFIGDVRDKDRLKLALNNIQTVIHAAALKIVPAAEYNPFECIKTNILGAQNLIDAIVSDIRPPIAGGVQKVIALSTDKAVHPINLYGATKLCAEKLFIAANNIIGTEYSKFSVVRYGNVANSNGSVIPLFQTQLKHANPFTITNEKMTRFWITLNEAVDFVLKSLDTMQGGETFVPDMPSFTVMDLAKAMCPSNSTEITGIRPGEKLSEEIITKEEFQQCDYNPETKMYTIDPSISHGLKEAEGKSVTSDAEFVKRLSVEELKVKLKEIGVIQ